jgi:hypothetical protein
VGIAQGMGTVVETPIWRPATVHEHAGASSENAVYAIPGMRLVGGDPIPGPRASARTHGSVHTVPARMIDDLVHLL